MNLASNILDQHPSTSTPTGREEAWRFTPLAKSRGIHDFSVHLNSRVSLAAKNENRDIALEIIDEKNLGESDDLVVTRVHQSNSKTLRVSVKPNIEITEPFFLTRTVESMDPEATRTLITIGHHARATIVVENQGSMTLAEEIEIHLEEGSSLHFVSLQEWAKGTVHFARHHAVVGKDATFTSTTITLGGDLVRILPTVEYTGPGASAELSGLYFATSGQHFEHRVKVDHNVAHAKSRVNYKGALSGDSARTVWFGDVLIRANAEGTDTYELNRNLLLSDGARADSVPNLEIETGEIVGAGHASTTGRFDDEQLFYLQSRGIPASIARQLVIRGFFLEIISQLRIPDLEERIMQKIDQELEESGKLA